MARRNANTKTLVARPLPPAKERILAAAKNLFHWNGIHLPLEHIANAAETNVDTILKYYGSWQGLVIEFLRHNEKHNELRWREVEQEHRDDPGNQIRAWLDGEEATAVVGDWSDFDLLRAACYVRPRTSPRLTAYIRKVKQQQRNLLAQKCQAAGYRDPVALADKLMILVHGALAGNLIYGENGPGVELLKAADIMILAHQGEVSRT